MYRKKERLDKSYAKEPSLAFLKAILVQTKLETFSPGCIYNNCLGEGELPRN